ncbi:hypothetical protein [Methylotenera sp.]|uniref:hypothetical protein n=1 Tax=Methylotenera sp. TaxID=2051956 RepID=UPI0027354594|nr:hypothetical protein [Methylotenera sp.]MDP3005299.1 hypothetical protein [Methylotenera sp.]
MCNPNYLANAIETVLTLDLPDHLLSIAIADQANLNAGFDCEQGLSFEWWDAGPERTEIFQ